jgi:hypothetical protein
VARAAPPSVQKCSYVVSLKSLPHPLSGDATRVIVGSLVCYRLIFSSSSFISPPKNYNLAIFIIGISILIPYSFDF